MCIISCVSCVLYVFPVHMCANLISDNTTSPHTQPRSYPIAAIGGTAQVMDCLADKVVQGGTYTANPIALRAGEFRVLLTYIVRDRFFMIYDL